FIQRDKNNYDFIILSNALTEIFKSEKVPLSFIKSLFERLKKFGIIILIEPALKTLTRRLMKLHNDIIVNRIGFILSPCLHNSKCPGLHKKEEWCHQSIKWNPPEYLKMINQKLFRKIEYLKFSYLIISNYNFNSLPANHYPVISRLSIEKGRIKCFICTEGGIVELIRLNRERSVINESFDHVCMGDIIEINNPLMNKSKIWKISRDTNIKRLDF
ncbi:MAG: small ribosomal subunit Rsm22 family protein, partial [candidate division WOR-3 bacterium]